MADRKTEQQGGQIIADGSHSGMVPARQASLHSIEGGRHEQAGGPEIAMQQRFGPAEFRQGFRERPVKGGAGVAESAVPIEQYRGDGLHSPIRT